jgi:uncharacterized phage protein (TIGR02218 family)
VRALSEDFQTHIRGEVTTLCRCWIIETSAGEKIGFTDHDVSITVDNTLCERDAGMETSLIEERLGLSVNSAEVSGALSSDFIREDDIMSGKFDNARISTWLVNWMNPQEALLDRVYLIGEVTREDGAFRMELRGLTSILDQTKGKHFQRRCQANLGDHACKVDLSQSQFSQVGQVTRVLGGSIVEVSGLESFDAGWFSQGQLEWTSGDNTNRKIEVLAHKQEGSTITFHLWQPMPSAIVLGDQFLISAGCDRLFATCKAKFSNTLNFQGFPHVPGNAFSLTHAGNSDQFDGSPIIP